MENKIFETSRGSQYFRNADGTWTRIKSDGTLESRYVYLGSIDEGRNPAFTEAGLDKIGLMKQIESGIIPGFVPKFEPGKVPLGLRIKPGEVLFRDGKLVPRNPSDEGSHYPFHRGDKITKVYERQS